MFVSPQIIQAKPTPFDHSHKIWNQILSDHVSVKNKQAQFDYKKLKAKPGKFPQYLDSLSKVSKKEFKSWNEKQRLAFLINAYNAFTVKLITDKYPLKSIKDLGGLFSSPWKKKFFTLLGEKAHLDHIEHTLIRKNFEEPRIHAAVNCASISCPNLMGTAFTAKRLDKQLEEATTFWLKDPTKNYFDKKKKTLFLSKIFDWYEKDFQKKGNSVHKFVAPGITSSKEEAQMISTNPKIKIKYLKYDWGLNETKSNGAKKGP